MASRHTPTSAVSVKASRSTSSALRGDRAASEVATRTAIVDVVETLSARDPPSRAYTAIGAMHVYSPISTGSPAMVAYAIACGITTVPAARPARTSRRHHDGW